MIFSLRYLLISSDFFSSKIFSLSFNSFNQLLILLSKSSCLAIISFKELIPFLFFFSSFSLISFSFSSSISGSKQSSSINLSFILFIFILKGSYFFSFFSFLFLISLFSIKFFSSSFSSKFSCSLNGIISSSSCSFEKLSISPYLSK